jgi:hypothetical protein
MSQRHEGSGAVHEQLKDLESRLTRAEARERVTRWGMLALVVLGAALFVARPARTQAQSNMVRAPFVVTNDVGRPLFTVDATDAGGEARILNLAGKTTASIYTDRDGGNMAVRNGAGRNVGILAGPTGGILDLRTPDGNQAAVIYAGVDGGNLAIRDKKGKDVALLLAAPTGGGRLAVYDPTGRPLFHQP